MNRKEQDMYLPDWVGFLGLFFLLIALLCSVLIFTTSVFWMIGFLISVSLAISEILSWKNQGIRMKDEYSFVYTTTFGSEKDYKFSEIRELKRSSDSSTLILTKGKVRIENCAIVSKRFSDAVDAALKKV